MEGADAKGKTRTGIGIGKGNILGKTKELTGRPCFFPMGSAGPEKFFAEEQYKICAEALAEIQPVDRMRETAVRGKMGQTPLGENGERGNFARYC